MHNECLNFEISRLGFVPGFAQATKGHMGCSWGFHRQCLPKHDKCCGCGKGIFTAQLDAEIECCLELMCLRKGIISPKVKSCCCKQKLVSLQNQVFDYSKGRMVLQGHN